MVTILKTMISRNTRKRRQNSHEWAIQRIIRRTKELTELSNRLSWVRLFTGISTLFLTVMAFQFLGALPGWLVLLGFVVGFIFLVRYHNRIDATIQKFNILREIKSAHIGRMQVDWQQIPDAPELEPVKNHPFNQDLNITGERSLHRILNTAMTKGGQQMLADWLLQEVPEPDAAEYRQQLVSELTPLNSFRDRVELNARYGMDADEGHWTAERVLQWLDKEKPAKGMRKFLMALGLGAFLNIALFILWLVSPFPPYFVLTFILYFSGFILSVRYFKDLVSEADALESSLASFSSVLRYIEDFKFRENSALKKFFRVYQDPEQRPSRLLRRIAVIAGAAANSQRSQIGWLVLNAIVPWDLYYAWRLEHLKSELQHALREWLQTWYQLEALSSLANFAYLNPGTVYPEIQPGTGSPHFSASQIGHPLIHSDERVCNDFSMDNAGDVVLITGSNMSGKSTFLRTLGVNLVLAYAGAPVVAESLQITPFRLFTCIQISDSLSDGISYFYAEVRRLRRLLDAYYNEEKYPLFFLIDEIFRGTNNRERLAGSRSVIKALTRGDGLGIIATHDLELTHLEEDISHIRNYHFREHISEGKLEFDYTLRKGPCPTTNALKIMQLEGLPVT